MQLALTTVNLPAYEIGAAASNILIDQIEGIEKDSRQQLLTGSLVVRGTTAKAVRA